MHEISSFLSQTDGGYNFSWSHEQLQQISTRDVPDAILTPLSHIFKADIKFLWSKWFLESLFDPKYYVRQNKTVNYSDIFLNVYKVIEVKCPEISIPQKKEIASLVAKLLTERSSVEINKGRTYISSRVKKDLWSKYSSNPRCYICGYKFSDWAIDKFLNASSITPLLPEYVDFLKPIGITPRSMQIEVEHVIPVASGGGLNLQSSDDEFDNLRLACGWCNSRKGSKNSIYDQHPEVDQIYHPKLGMTSIPKGFWTVRVLALQQTCEYNNGCDNNVHNSELTIAPRRVKGSMNPLNLQVTCRDHDPIKEARLIHRKFFEKQS